MSRRWSSGLWLAPSNLRVAAVSSGLPSGGPKCFQGYKWQVFLLLARLTGSRQLVTIVVRGQKAEKLVISPA